MFNPKLWLLVLVLSIGYTTGYAHINPKLAERPKDQQRVKFREGCDQAASRIDQSINNVRARLLTGGDVWWDPGSSDGRYVVPKVPAGVPEVSSIFAGAVWLGGVDPAGNLKVAAQQYGSSSGDADFWPGPLDPETGTIEQEICAKWDQFFVVYGTEIDEHLRNWQETIENGAAYNPADIPRNVLGWPARGNQFFFDVHQFELPNTSQGLAKFWDQNGNGLYDPDLGDYPVIEVRGCDQPQYPDEMFFWIYNDNGNIHSESNADPIQMEIQVQAFAFATNDEINDMTFQRYKLINRAIESIDSTFFAMWVDADLGCYTDDYIGCDTLRSLMYVYNADAADGQTGCSCPQGVNTYCEEIPILGVDYFRGPLDEFGRELGMSSFTYFNNGGVGTPPAGTTDPGNAQEYYNYLSGSWRDGSPFTFGGDAYQDGPAIDFAFTEAPDNPNGWSMCTAADQNNPDFDRRTVQASGPFRLDPGAVNELIIGAVWVADQDYPCPSISKLQDADDTAQALFDNCFDITDGPDAPDVDIIELDQELVLILTNSDPNSNNLGESYAERGLEIPPTVEDSLYVFEGYKIYQLSGPDVTLADLDDPDKAFLAAQVDVKNNITKLFNWESVETPLDEAFLSPVLEVEGTDSGIRHTFKITEDRFAAGDRRLVNHKKYYFTVIAYAHNEYQAYDPFEGTGQEQTYLEGRRNIGDGTNPFYTAIPRPINYLKLGSDYGDGAVITRIDGKGVGNNFIDISEETEAAILDGSFQGEITYKSGEAPIDIAIFNPLEVVNGEYELTFVDSDLTDAVIDKGTYWKLTRIDNGDEVLSAKTIDQLNEQVIQQFGFSVTIGQTDDVGDNATSDNGLIGGTIELEDPTQTPWLSGVVEGTTFSGLLPPFYDILFDFILTGPNEEDEALDPTQSLRNVANFWQPFALLNYRGRSDGLGYITPAWTDGGTLGAVMRQKNPIQDLNNVDIVFTPDKSKWSRCVIIETANPFFEDEGFLSEGGQGYFDLRAAPSVGQEDNDGDGLPDPDGDGEGMGWFPGYAIDVETGERLNIFFGENSIYDGSIFPDLFTEAPTGNDMMWNPTSQLYIPSTTPSIFNAVAGCHHFVYVTREAYDGCENIRRRLVRPQPLAKEPAIRLITWAGIPLVAEGETLTSYQEGLIPAETIVKLRVDNPYEVSVGTGAYNGYPTYRFTLEGVEAEPVSTTAEIDSALSIINVAPNPYYGYSAYEVSQFSNIVKITNLPAKCQISIYSLDGRFIRSYNRDETPGEPNGTGIRSNQIIPDIEWDLKNSRGIPVASGVYLIHIDAGDLGERVIKWFGISRKYDPSGL